MPIANRLMEGFDRDALDQVRGVLCSLANRGETYYSPISTLSIRFALERRNRVFAPADQLQLLHAIGDVQRLPGGYWLPVSTTLVPLGTSTIVISGEPTQTLKDRLGTTVGSRGYSRVVSQLPAQVPSPPQRTFASWCSAPTSTAAWTKHYIASAEYSRQFIDVGFECFNHWATRAATLWLDSTSRMTIPDGIVLARARNPIGTLYLLCRFRGGRPIGVSEIGDQWSTAFRLAFGLRALHGSSTRFRIRRESETTFELRLTRFLPSEETMVLRALGEVRDETATTLEIVLDATEIQAVVQMLTSLGFAQEGD